MINNHPVRLTDHQHILHQMDAKTPSLLWTRPYPLGYCKASEVQLTKRYPNIPKTKSWKRASSNMENLFVKRALIKYYLMSLVFWRALDAPSPEQVPKSPKSYFPRRAELQKV
ncbi:hypothetical protein NPIL_272681 [Nephila pilipes]|uniref:Uncharacterized protein n=1 Tax=Nephila pilipes TaxID=299642 RepID=A0A8X6MRN4_NEPPI|nr:hypothetical protein NPIL_272681 [Nephila pilipes]